MPGLSVGILLGVLVIVTAWVLIVVYVRWANRHYDARDRQAEERAMTTLARRAERRRPSSASSSSSGCRSAITWWAARRTRSTEHFYAAGRSITAFQNGLALAGDYMSAASFLGIAGLVALSGFDGLIYSIGLLVGWPVVMFLIAEPLRNLGKYTFADVVALPAAAGARCASRPPSGRSRSSSFYLIAQMVGAGNLDPAALRPRLRGRDRHRRRGDARLRAVRRDDRDDLGADRQGGAAAGGALLLAMLVLARFGFNPLRAVRGGARISTAPACSRRASSCRDPLDAISLGLALMFGTAGLPHILMRFYTVPDAATARVSVIYATGFIGFFYLLTFILGFGAMVLVGPGPITRRRRRRQHGGAAARRSRRRARRSSASSPRWRSRRSSRWSPASRWPAPRRCRTISG